MNSIYKPSIQQDGELLTKTVERLMGESVATICSRTVWEQRLAVEQRHGTPLRFISRFPFIGRGNVMRDRLIHHDSVNRKLESALERI